MARPDPPRPDIAVPEAHRRIRWCLEKGRDHLNLVGLGLTDADLPPEFARLDGLRYLDLTGNCLTRLPEGVVDFPDLLWLGLNDNRLEALPDSVARWTQLERLYLRNNRLQELPADLGDLPRLVELDLHGNRIANLPRSFLRLLKRPPAAEALYFDLEDNPGQVAVVARQGAEALRDYLEQLAAASVRRCEGKLLFVGEGGVGKSTLLEALQTGSFVKDRGSTHGLKLGDLELPTGTATGTVRLNGWDFSGQVEVRETHQIFFTAPAIYLLVWNARQGEYQGRLEEWLWLIKHRTQGRGRVLVVCTQTGQHAGDLEQAARLREQFAGPDGILLDPCFLRVECDPAAPGGQRGLDTLREFLARTVAGDRTYHQEIPATWDRAVQDITENRDATAFQPWTDFVAFCGKHEIPDAAGFARVQHRLGRLVWIEKEGLAETVILNPDWLSKAIGYVLHDPQGRNESPPAASDTAPRPPSGILADQRIAQIWSNPPATTEDGRREHAYPPHLFPIFHRLMAAFDLAHRVRGDHGENLRLIPNRLPSEPRTAWNENWAATDILLRRRIDLLGFDGADLNEWLASSFVFRLMVRLFPDSRGHDDYHQAPHWRRGFRLERPYGEARIQREGSHLYFEALGTDPFALWERFEFAVETLAEELSRELGYGILRRPFVSCTPPCERDTASRKYWAEEDVTRWATSKTADERLERIGCDMPGCRRNLDVQRLWLGQRGPTDIPSPVGACLERIETQLGRVEATTRRTEAKTDQILERLKAVWDAQARFAEHLAPQLETLSQRLSSEAATATRSDLDRLEQTLRAALERLLARLDHADRPECQGPRLFSLRPKQPGLVTLEFQLRLHCERCFQPVDELPGTNGLGTFDLTVDEPWWALAKPYVRGTARLLGWLGCIGKALAEPASTGAWEAANDMSDRVEKGLTSSPKAPPEALLRTASHFADSHQAEGDIRKWLHAFLVAKCHPNGLNSTLLGLERVEDRATGSYLWVHPTQAVLFR